MATQLVTRENGATIDAPSTKATQPTDTATLLFLRKVKFAEQYSCRDLFAELESADRGLVSLVETREALQLKIRHLQADVEDTRTLLALGVEGKNEGERKARLVEATRQDPAYTVQLSELRAMEQELATLESGIEAVKRQAKRCERGIEYRTAIIRALGS